jgi:hypothetical protein
MSTQTAPPDPTLDQFREYMDGVTRQMPIWRHGSEGFWTSIRIAELKGSVDAQGATDRFAFARGRRMWQDAQGVMVRWGHEIGTLEPFFDGLSSKRKIWERGTSALKHAAQRPQVDTAIGGFYIGHHGYETSGHIIRFPATRELGIEAWEHSVDPYFKASLPDTSAVQSEIQALQSWAQESGSRDDLTNDLYLAARRVGRHLRQQAPRELPGSIELPGFTLGDAHKMWDVIHGHAWIALLLLRARQDVTASLLCPLKDALIDDLAAESDTSKAEAFVDFLTFDADRHPDPALAPLIQTAERIVFTPTLIINSRFERNLLKLLALRHDLYGPVGDWRGKEGAKQVGNLMRSIQGVDVAHRVAVERAQGRAGDFDVVAVDNAIGRGLICEVKWPGPPDSIVEISKAEDEIIKGQNQLVRLKREIAEGEAVAKLPKGWRPFEDTDWTYAVICKGQAPCTDRLLKHEIYASSWEVLWNRPSRTLDEVRTAIAEGPPRLSEEIGFTRNWSRQKIGVYTVEIEGIGHVDLDAKPVTGVSAPDDVMDG